jgi:hypothetical protein
MNVKVIPIHDAVELFWAAALWWLEQHGIDTSLPIIEDPEPETKSFADMDPSFRIALPELTSHQQLKRLNSLASISATWFTDDSMQAIRVLNDLEACCDSCGIYCLRTSEQWNRRTNKCRACSERLEKRQVA